MAMPRIIAQNLKGKSKPKGKVISEFADKASPVNKKTRSGATERYRGGKKNGR